MNRTGLKPVALTGIVALLLMLGLMGCAPTRRLKPSEYLLKKQTIKEIGETVNNHENIEDLLTPVPNKKLFGVWRFYLQLHELPNPEKVESKRAFLDARRDSLNGLIRQKNLDRIKKGKKAQTTEIRKTYLQ